ncbi:hypothetical protein FisN_1Lh088 [Fistulifera solaris]|uniref:Uncharacterized protein n=1 Tax=Fistulifera solaris TaxID=1519565 RepID=A0A1Z5K4W7_FISSO|nr:hypothetical protein FisN_1Lh088 [Fistulifera solaris]|eukprot:GAX21259.1 hypothetical protein FisN_1Lh088 [Fistulifera solaris]
MMGTSGISIRESGQRLPQNFQYTSSLSKVLTSKSFCSIPTKEADLRSNALTHAAQEAERSILSLRLAEDSTAKTSDSAHHDVEETIKAAQRLLAVSRSPSIRVEVFSEQRNSPQYATLHRVFLQLISRLLDHAFDKRLTDYRVTVLHASLSMARRVHELGLPLHLPLHERLMQSFAEWGELLIDENPARLILEAAAWSPCVTAHTFHASLCGLIETRRFSCAADLLKGMRVDYKLERMEIPYVRDVLFALEKSIEDSIAEQWSAEVETRLIPNLSEIQDIVGSLEYFVQHVFHVETLGIGNVERLDSLDEDQAESFFKRVLSKQDAEFFDEEKLEVSQYTTRDDEEKSIVTQSVLLSGCKDKKVRALLIVLLDRKPLVPRNSASRTNRQFHSLGSVVDAENHQVFQAYAVGQDESDSDLSDSERILPFMDIIYSRQNLFEFPDITGQLVALNKGKALVFTAEYEHLLWARDYEEEMDMLADSMAPDYDSNDSDDDDDDDDGDGSGSNDF